MFYTAGRKRELFCQFANYLAYFFHAIWRMVASAITGTRILSTKRQIASQMIKIALALFRSRAYLIVMETIQVRTLAASKAKGKLEPFEFSLGSLAADQIDIKVQYCGICH
jgi:hypothetical protein